jgi:hypothetical protein
VDNVYVSNSIPAALTNVSPTTDINGDGIVDAVEIMQYGVIAKTVPGDFPTLSNALAAALAGERILVSDGTYAETLVVSNNVTLVGTNVMGLASLTVLSNQTAVLSGFTTFSVANLVIQSNATVVVSNSTLTANGVTLTGTFTLDSGWGGSLTPSSLNYTNDFESYPTNMPLALCGGQGWGASESGSIIQGSVFTNGAKAAMVMQHSALSNTVSAAGVNKVWTDIWLNDSAARVSGLPYISTNANRAVMLFVNTNNNIVIWNSNAWDECVSNALGGLAPTVATGTWVRVSVFEDFTAQKVALFVNGQLLRQQVPFMSPMASYKGLSLSAGAGLAYMDDVKIWTNIPASLTNYDQSVNDVDHDGVADAVEIAQNGTLLYDPPRLSAPSVSAVDTNAATLGAVVTNDGSVAVTSWGTVWDTNLNPIAHAVTFLGSTNAPFSFSTNQVGFSPGQHYYIRGWASNAMGMAYSTNGEFYAEPVQATNITYVPVPGGFTISWTADVTSTGTVVLVKQGAPVDAAPEDGSNYVATAFGSGTYLGVSNYIVYVGSGSNVTVNNLSYGSSYQVAAFAYAGHDNLIQYRTNSPPTCILVWPPRGSVYTIR